MTFWTNKEELSKLALKKQKRGWLKLRIKIKLRFGKPHVYAAKEITISVKLVKLNGSASH